MAYLVEPTDTTKQGHEKPGQATPGSRGTIRGVLHRRGSCTAAGPLVSAQLLEEPVTIDGHGGGG